MNCPKCGNELSPGWMVQRKICYLEWAPEHWYFPLLPKNKVLRPGAALLILWNILLISAQLVKQ